MTLLAHIADRFLGRPLMLTPEKAEVVLQVLDGRINVAALNAEGLTPVPADASAFAGNRRADSGMARMSDAGVAIVPIIGSLVHRGAWIGASSGLVSYEGLTAQLKALAADASVKAILLDVNSPGGEATSGAFDVPALIREINATKPVVAVANDMICSAAYAIASGAGEIWVNDLSIVGSIGVIMVHLDRSAEMTIKGIKPTIIRSDSSKAQGNSLEPLSAEALGLFKAEVDRIKSTFIATVIAGRPNLTEAAISALGAHVFHGADAIAKGLADKQGTFFDALSALDARVSAAPGVVTSPVAARKAAEDPNSVTASEHIEPSKTETTMSKTAQESPASDAGIAVKADANDNPAPATPATASTPGVRVEDVQARIAQIIDAPEAKGREAMARHLAFNTQTPAADAIELLKMAPQGSVADPIVGAGVTQSGVVASAAPKSGVERGADVVARIKKLRGEAA